MANINLILKKENGDIVSFIEPKSLMSYLKEYCTFSLE